jgi:hypothetical protein
MDHEAGEWFETTAWRDRQPLSAVKGHEWKDPYHPARALMEVSRELAALLAGTGPRRPINFLALPGSDSRAQVP